MALDWGYVLNAAGGLAVASLGLAVLLVKPRRLTGVAFAVFSLGWGVGYIGRNLVQAGVLPSEWLASAGIADAIAFTCATGALMVLALSFPEPLPRAERRLLVLPGLVLAASLPVLLWSVRSLEADTFSMPREIANRALTMAQWSTVCLFALRAAVPPVDAARQRRYAVTSIALALFPATNMSGFALHEVAPLRGTSTILACVLAALLWLRAAHRSADPRVGRTAAWALLSFSLGALLFYSWRGTTLNEVHGVAGATRILTVLLFAYAIVQHQLLGLDVKLRFAISRSSVAAVFIAVFFVASEGAQILFGRDNELIGLVAAGGLVFALAPLQRAADRLAARAVPSAAEAPREPEAAVASERELSYRHAVELAVRDHTLTREEERRLMQLAHHLHIPPLRAAAIHDAVEGMRAGERADGAPDGGRGA